MDGQFWAQSPIGDFDCIGLIPSFGPGQNLLLHCFLLMILNNNVIVQNCVALCCVHCPMQNEHFTVGSVWSTVGQYKASAALTMPVIRQIVAACPSLHLSTNLGSAIHSSCVLPSNIVLCTWAVRCCTGVQLNLYWAALHRSVGRMSRPEWHKGDISSTTLHQETL